MELSLPEQRRSLSSQSARESTPSREEKGQSVMGPRTSSSSFSSSTSTLLLSKPSGTTPPTTASASSRALNTNIAVLVASIYSVFVSICRTMFLPIDYPNSVSSDYYNYQLWDTLSGFCGYVKQILCTQAYLRGMGIGDAKSSLSSAMTIQLARDSTGVVAGLLVGVPFLTNLFSDKGQIVYWRTVSEVLKIIAGFIEIYASMYSRNHYLLLSCVVIVFYTISGVMIAQTQATLMRHFAIANNQSDCKAKESNQEKGVKVFGIPLALVLLSTLENNSRFVWHYYFAFCVLQFLFNQAASYSLQIKDDKKKANND